MANANHEWMRTAAPRLEAGEILYFESCPFALPAAERTELCALRLQDKATDIAYNALLHRVDGFVPRPESIAIWLNDVLPRWGKEATYWLKEMIPEYSSDCELDYVAFHPEEEATRALGL